MLTELIFWVVLTVILYNLIVLVVEQINIGEIQDKAVVISGTDTGFGNGLMYKCLENGMTVFAGFLTEEGRANAETKVMKLGLDKKFHGLLLDVTKDESVAKAVGYVRSVVGDKGLHGLCNNAGIAGQNGWDDWMTVQSYRIAYEVNTLGLIRMTHAFKPLIKKAKGRIVNTASICGRVALPLTGPYNVSKYGVEAYSDTLRAELAAFGVTVCILEPGFFATHLTDSKAHTKMLDRQWESLSQETREEYGAHMLEFAKAGVKQNLEIMCSKDTWKVVNAYFHALTSVLPRRRYQIGWDSILFFIPFSMLPAIVQDNFFRLVGCLQRMPKPAALK